MGMSSSGEGYGIMWKPVYKGTSVNHSCNAPMDLSPFEGWGMRFAQNRTRGKEK